MLKFGGLISIYVENTDDCLTYAQDRLHFAQMDLLWDFQKIKRHTNFHKNSIQIEWVIKTGVLYYVLNFEGRSSI